MSSIYITFIFVFICYYQVYKKNQVINIMRRRVNGLDDLLPLRNLLECIPQHRGMANAFLLGDQSFRGKLDVLDVKIDKEIKNVFQQLTFKDKWGLLEQIEVIGKDWAFIKQKLSGLEAAESFLLHTLLVKKIISIISELGDTANILTTQDKAYAKLAAAIFLKLPIMTEMMGQARGMGTGIATKGICDTKMRVKLTYLLNNTRNISVAVSSEVQDALSHNKELKQQTNSVLKDNQHATEHFLFLLDKNIINEKNITLSSSEYYDAGTEAIQLAFALMDKISLSMQNNLQGFIKKLSFNLMVTKILSGCISLGLILGVFYF